MVNELMRYEKEKYEISFIIDEEHDYKKAIQKCREFIQVLRHNDGINDDLWFAYISITRCYNFQSKSREAITTLKTARKYIPISTDSYYHYVWMMGRIYSGVGLKSKALKIYIECNEYYTKRHMQREYLILRNNIALLTNDLRLIDETIKEYEPIDNDFERKNYFLNLMKETKEEILESLNKKHFIA